MRYLFLFVASTGLFFGNNKIVYILASPRSLSTVFFCMFENRKDFTGILQPSSPIVWQGDQDLRSHYFHKEAFKTMDDAYDFMLKKQKTSHVVIKDAVFHRNYLSHFTPKILQNPDVHFVFLIRHPYQIIKSIYKKSGSMNEEICDAVGLEYLSILYDQIKSESTNRVHLVFANDLLKQPRVEMSKLLSSIELELTDESFSWDSLDETFTGKEWNSQYTQEHFHKWCGEVLSSTELYPHKTWSLPSDECLYSEIENEDDREMMIRFYKHHHRYYSKFLEVKKS